MREINLLRTRQANGGQIVPLENQADVKIMDHARKEVQPGRCVAPSPVACSFDLGLTQHAQLLLYIH